VRFLSLWSPKGGAGKTTTALHLAGAYAARGFKVVVVDLDPQRSALSVQEFATTPLPFEIVAGWPKSPEGIEVMIADCPPGFSEAPETGTVIMPFQPSPLDMASAYRAIETLRSNRNLRILRVLTMVDLRENEQRTLANHCMEHGEIERIIKRRSAYRRTLGMGLTVHSAQVANMQGVRDARTEIDRLADIAL